MARPETDDIAVRRMCEQVGMAYVLQMTNQIGQTLLHAACLRNNIKLVTALIECAMLSMSTLTQQDDSRNTSQNSFA